MRKTIAPLSLVLLAGLAPAAVATPAPAKVFLTVDEALTLAFPECAIERRRIYLTPDEEHRIEKLGKVDLDARIAHAYEARREGALVGTAYFDVHKVRTLRETVMVVVDTGERIRRIELLAFGEPEDYIPRSKWYGQFVGKGLADELEIKRGIRGVTGATLTARATAAAARRSLALHHVIGERPAQ